MPSGQVPLWVPLAVALVGFLGVITTQVLGARREDRRWLREQEREERRWCREKEHDIATLQLDRKLEAYVGVFSAVDAWGWRLFPIAKGVLAGERALTDQDKEALAELRQMAENAMGPMNLYATEEVRDAIWRAISTRADFMRELAMDDRPIEALDIKWKESWDKYRDMRKAIRDDFDLSLARSKPTRESTRRA